MPTTAAESGLRFEVAPPPPEPAPLRSDVAGFAGRTRRGPLGVAVRVAEWRDYLRVFGGLEGGAATPYAVRSYFENGGEVAWVVRLAGAGAGVAEAFWPGSGGEPLPAHEPPADPERAAFRWRGLALDRFRLYAATPGAWAEGAQIALDYRRRGARDRPELDLEVRAPGEPVERLRGLPVADAEVLAAAVGERSALIRIEPAPAAPAALPAASGPARRSWTVWLGGGGEPVPAAVDYLDGVAALGREREPALTVLPDLHADLPPADGDPEADAWRVLRAAIADAERRLDRLVLIDLPPALAGAEAIERALGDLAAGLEPAALRAAAAYHPPLWLPDPLGGRAEPLVLVPATGPVAGLISRLDRERGAHHTPANAPLLDAVDGRGPLTAETRRRLAEIGVNPIRCFPNRGLTVWGGRTLSRLPEGRFVAHRRLIHRLVRAIRRTAEPLVFDVNGPELWLTFVRAVTAVLLAAWRAGALAGGRPEEAFRVTCDETTNPPEEIDLGRVVCEIELAPATPMERITLRVALGREGELEVFSG